MANIKKLNGELSEGERKIKKARMKMQLTCPHQKRPHEPDLEMREHHANGNLKAYFCRACSKFINMKAPTNADVDDAYQTLETMTDYIRLTTDPSTDKGKEVCELCGEIMMKLFKLVKAYKAMRDEKDKKAKRSKERRGQHSSAHFET